MLVNCVKESLSDVRHILVFRKERVAVRDCKAMVRGRLYADLYSEIRKMGFENAKKYGSLMGGGCGVYIL